ncbi:MAG: hypothetical protein M1826_004184 [Phylliscum demangeonii]|nr:MAG: hypothetical protein M1826_004184 [Phylliscum demangeonii]
MALVVDINSSLDFAFEEPHHSLNAPKAPTPQARQDAILSYLRQSGTVHSIKDLEKALPAIASINGMQVKEYLQGLTDDGKIRVEKIGTGNWYWSFVSEEKRARRTMLDGLRADEAKATEAGARLRAQMVVAAAGDLEHEHDHDAGGAGDGHDRVALLKARDALQQEVAALQAALAQMGDRDPVQLDKKRADTQLMWASSRRWTDNIYCLEYYYLQMNGGDRADLEDVRRWLYGDDYRFDGFPEE